METMSAGGSAISITQLLSFQSHDDFKVIFLGNPYITLRFLFSIYISSICGITYRSFCSVILIVFFSANNK